MRRFVFLLLAFVLCLPTFAEEIRTRTGSDKAVELEATLFNDSGDIKKALGEDLNGEFVVVRIRVTPKSGELPVYISDFTLFSEKNGERSWPYTADQIAGGAALVIGQKGGGAGVMTENPGGPIWGGLGGGRPGRWGGNGSTIGNSGGPATVTSEMKQSKAEESKLDALSTVEWKDGTIEKPASGFLYFPMDGKHKDKHLKLFYKTPAGKIILEFK